MRELDEEVKTYTIFVCNDTQIWLLLYVFHNFTSYPNVMLFFLSKLKYLIFFLVKKSICLILKDIV